MNVYESKLKDRSERETKVELLKGRIRTLEDERGKLETRFCPRYDEINREVNNLCTSIATQKRIIQNLKENKPSHGQPETANSGPKDYYHSY